MKTRVVVADDHSVVLEGMRNILERAGCEVVAMVDDGRQLVEAVEKLQPHLVVLDISMPVLNGVEAARQIREKNASIRIVFVSMHPDAAYIRESFRAGANGYLLKRTAVTELGKAVDEVMNGRFYITPLVTNTIAELLSAPEPGGFGSDLTRRQREVLQLVAEGRTAKEIAVLLNITVKTVEFHKSSIMDVVGLRTIADLTRYAVKHGIVLG